MAGISKRVIEDIRFRNDIVDVIGAAFPLKRAGGAFKACCPFHKEKTPSFHVNQQRQIFHCFGCGVGGDVFGFVMKYEGVDFTTAVRMLADRAGIHLEFDETASPEQGARDTLLTIHRELAAFYRRCLERAPGADAARAYLQARDLAGETEEAFLIGYAPNRWDALLRWAAEHSFKAADLETAGLIIRRDSGDGWYDRFRDRLMFPIRDIQGRVIGFSGRALQADAKGAKYINSPETPLFHKGRVLFAMDRARHAMVETREAILCEGQIDVIRCHQAGFTQAVASQGTAFTEDHARLLHRYVDSVVVVFDSDRAGQDAAVKSAGIFLQAGLGVRVATLPAGEDPDSFIRAQGADAFGAILREAAGVVDFQIDVLAARENLNSDVGAMRAARAVADTINHTPNAVQRTRLLQTAALRLNLPVAALQGELRAAHRQAPRAGGEQTPDAAPAAPVPPEERALCEHLVLAEHVDGIAALVRAYLPLDHLADARARVVLEAALRAAAGEGSVEDLLRDRADDTALAAFLASILMGTSKVEGHEAREEDAVRDLVLAVWRRQFARERETLEARAERSPAEESRLIQLTMDLKALRQWETGAEIIELELGH